MPLTSDQLHQPIIDLAQGVVITRMLSIFSRYVPVQHTLPIEVHHLLMCVHLVLPASWSQLQPNGHFGLEATRTCRGGLQNLSVQCPNGLS